MKKFTYLIAASLFLFSCDDSEEAQNEIEEKKQVDIDLDEEEESEINEIVFMIPSPQDQYDKLEMIGGEVNTSLVLDLEKVENFTTVEEKAMAFGIYSADAAYMMRFEQGKNVFMNYLSTLDRLAEDLGLSQLYDDELMEEVEEAGDDPYELFEISGDNYMQVYNSMIENDKGVELSLIIASSWIQEMYVLFETCGEFEGDLLVQEMIHDEQLVLENIKTFISDYTDNNAVATMLEYLTRVSDDYEAMDCTTTEIEVQKEEGKQTLFGGSSCVFTEDGYYAMKETVNEIRSSIIKK